MSLFTEDNFTFKGFDPNQSLKSYCKQIYCQVEDKSPSSASKTAFVVKTKEGYEGLIRVVSSSGTFMVTSSHKQAQDLIDNLYSQFTRQISHWSQNREFSYTQVEP